MNFIVKKTNEMSHSEKEAICDLFFDVFKIEKTVASFIKQFENSDFGYSYFCLMYDEDILVGSYAAIPELYNFFGNNVSFAQSVDTMIKANYRGSPFTLKKMTNKLYKELMNDQICFVYGFPNDKIYQIRERVLKWQNIYNLDIYFIPLKVSFISKYLKFIDYFVRLLVRFINIFVFNSDVLGNFNNRSIIKKNNLVQDQSNEIKIMSSSVIKYRYSIKYVKKIKIAIIGNIHPFCKQSFEKTVKEITKFDDIDLIAYIGHLDFKPINLIRVPKKIQPKKIRLSGRILLSDIVDDRVFDIKNWEINPLNFDWSS